MGAWAAGDVHAGAAEQVSSGTLLAGRYRLEERLPEEAGTTPWQATDQLLSRQVLVRTFPPKGDDAGEVIGAARAACRISDPRLTRIFDADDCAEPSYLVTEWPSGVPLGELLAAGPLGPLRAAGMVAAAADALAAAHEAGLAHLCLSPDSLWCDAKGAVKITGLGIAAALTRVRASDPALADTSGLARLLYAAVTGCWPGAGRTTLPPAPSSGGQLCCPRQLQPGIPAAIDSVICRALGRETCCEGPPILGPAQLAMELAAITRAGPPNRPLAGLVPALTRPLSPLVTAPAALNAAVSPRLPLPSIPLITSADRAGAPAAGSSATPRPRSARLPGLLRSVLRAAVLIVVLAALAGAGWLLVRQITAPHHPGPSGVGTGQSLIPVSAAAFGPGGTGDGDNPQRAVLALGGSPATGWHTDWYASARFGNLQPGTGLLLDMGHPVTITSAQVTLGGAPGADVQLRAGAAPALASLRPVAYVTDARGVLRIRIERPADSRYLLIWFTRLPRDSAGSYQASVYGVRLEGVK